MKRLGIHSASCSCTSCVYRSRSKQASVQQLIAEGSRIDKLYYGKYLPLRERKLLEKLIRTRAVYDDVRNQLLSTSGSSDQSRSVHKIKRRDDDSTEKSSAVLKIVDLVDRGQIGSSNTSKLSSCCSCCSCSSLRKIKKHMEKHPPKVHRHHVPYEDIARYTIEAEKRGRKRKRRLSAKISGKIRSVQFQMKQIRSEPCTCTLSLSSMIQRPSKAFIKKVRSKERAIANTQAQKIVTIERKALKKKICSCSCKIAKLPMKSIQKIKNIRRASIKTSGTETGLHRKFRIKKDSLTLFREKLLKKRALKDWECETGTCVVDECIPEQCFEKIKSRGIGGARRRKYHNRLSGTGKDRISISTRPKKVKRTDSKVQASPLSILGPVFCECKPTSKSASSMTSFPKSKSIVKIQSMTTNLKIKRPKSPKRAQVMLKETDIQEKTAGRYALKRTESFDWKEKEPVQASPKSDVGQVICECKPSTKSTGSMTTILKKQDLLSVSKTEIKVKRPMTPKARPQIVVKQEKAYKSSRREKELVQVSPKSNLGHVICECKPLTKSTSSMTYVPIYKTKIKPKASKPLKQTARYKPRQEQYKYQEILQEVQEPEKQAVKISSSFKFEIEFSKKKKPVLINKELIDHVQTKRAKRIRESHSKNKHNRKYRHSKIQVTGTLPKANRETKSSQESQVSYLKEIASQASKPLRKIVLPFPRECDPSMCIPYECDPRNCARILLSRSKSRGKSVVSNTDRLRRKSAGSTTLSLTTSSKSRYVQSKSTESFISKPSELTKPKIEKYDVSTDKSHPQGQAVRISSSFSFNIEFYKENAPDLKTAEKKDYSYNSGNKIVQKLPRKKYKEKSYGARNINARNISSQSRSSQSFKNVQVGHRLKRCFCTLKLLQNKRQKVKHAASKKTMASLYMKDLEKTTRIRKTQTKPSGISYVIPPPVISHPAALLPYECEPYFCTPGECNPYVCAERIKERNRKEAYRLSRETNTANTLGKSILTFTSQDLSKSSSRKIQSSENKNRKHKPVRSHASRSKSIVSSDNTQKQAVRVGSSLSFNIEFSKEKNDHLVTYKNTAKDFLSDEPIKKEKRRMQHKGIKVYKPRVHPTASSTTKNVKSKQTYTTPFLQKCFCTLKLFKKNKKIAEAVTPRRNRNDYIVQMQNKSIITNKANIEYHPEQCLPHECEPGICALNECDPDYYENLINLRHMKLQDTYSNTDDCTTVSTISSKSRYTKTYSKGFEKKSKRIIGTDRDANEPNIASSQIKRQVARVGSSCNFNIEFYNKKPSTNSNNEYFIMREGVSKKQIFDDSVKKYNHKKELQIFDPRLYHKAIDAKVKRKEKGICISSAIKRCFCTLKLNKKGKSAGLQKKNRVISKSTKTSYYPLLDPQLCDCKSTSTNISRPIFRNFKSHVCAPDFSISGMCNPSKCYEEIQQREIKRLYDRHIGTDGHKRRSISSMTTSELRTQSRFLIQTQTKDHSVRMVQENVMPTSYISPSRQTVRLGSNFNINLDFFKDSAIPAVQHTIYKIQTDKFNKISDIATAKIKKDKGTQDKRITGKGLSQDNNIHKEKKASNVGFLLKRCFCTLGLQKKCIIPKIKKPKHTFYGNQPITAQFVQVLRDDQNKKKASNFVCPDIKRKPELKRVNDKFDKNLYQRESLELNLSGSSYPIKQNILNVNRNSKKNICYTPQHSSTSSSFRRSTNFRSHIDFNIDEYKVGYSNDNDTLKTNPFYQSLYALNLKVSNLKNVPANTRGSKRCDPVQCKKKKQNLLVHSRLSGTNGPKTKSVGSNKINKFKSKSKTAKYLNKCRQKLCQNNNLKDLRVGSDIGVGVAFYKDTDRRSDDYMLPLSHNSNLNKSLRVGTDFNIDLGFFKDTNPHSDGLMLPTLPNPKLAKDISTRRSQSNIRHNGSQINAKSQSKTNSLLKRCICSLKLKKKSDDQISLTDAHLDNKKERKKSYHTSRHKHSRVGTDFSVGVDFFNNTNINRDNNKTRTSQHEKNIQRNHNTESREVRNKTKRKSSRLPKCLCPIKTKTDTQFEIENRRILNSKSHNALRVGSDLKIAMGFFKDTNTSRGGIKTKQEKNKQQRHPQHTSSHEVRNKTKDKSSRLAKCICPIKTKTDTQLKIENRNVLNSKSRHALRVGSDLSIAIEFFKHRNTNRGVIKSSLSRQEQDIQQRYTESPEIRNKIKGCLCQIKPKTDTHIKSNKENPKQSLQSPIRNTGSQINIESQNKVKGISNVLQRCFCTNKNKKADKGKKGIKPVNDQTNKENAKTKKDKATIVKKPYGNDECAPNVCGPEKCDPHKCFKLIQKRKKKNPLEHAIVGTDHSKHKPTPSVAKKMKTKTVTSKPKDWLSSSKYNFSKEKQEHETFKRPSEKRAVSFGSNFNLNMEFFKDETNLLSSNLSPASTKSPAQFQVFYSSVEGSGDNRRKPIGVRQNGLSKRGKKHKKYQDSDRVICKCSRKDVKHVLKPNQCEPHTCVPGKCESIECEQRIKKRRFQSTTTKTKGEKKTTSLKSADIGSTAKKGKQISKSFDQCSPQNCKEMFKQLGLGDPERNKTSKKKPTILNKCLCILKLKKSKKLTNTQSEPGISISKQTELNKFIKKCICTLKPRNGGKKLTPKQSTERIIDSKRKAKLKGTKTPKLSSKLEDKKPGSEMKTIMPYSKRKFKKHESQTKVRQDSCNCLTNQQQNSKLKEDKNTKKQNSKHPDVKNTKINNKKLLLQNQSEICPVCRDLLNQNSDKNKKSLHINKKTNRQGLYPQDVKKSKGKKNNKGQILQNEDDTVICPLCRDIANEKNKKSLHTCDCPQVQVEDDKSKKKKKAANTIHSRWCPEKIGDHADPCPMCLASEKQNKKRAKQKLLHTCVCPEQIDPSNLNEKQKIDQMSSCPVCNAGLNRNLSKSGKKQNKKYDKKRDLLHPVEQQTLIKFEKKPRGNKKNKEPISQIDDQSDVCPCCKAKLKLEKKKKQDVLEKIKCICSSMVIKQKNKLNKKPLFEMVVNEHNMNIMNRDEVLANLGSTGKESRVMKKARKAYDKGRAEPPLMDMLIDINSASIINSDDVLHTVYTGKKKQTTGEKRLNLRKALATSGIANSLPKKLKGADTQGERLNSLECKSLGAADTQKKALVKQTKSEGKAHDSKCECCECRGRRRKRKHPKPAIKPRKLKPCVCGSVVCKKKWEKLKKEERSVKGLKIKPCVCGSPICREESQKMPDILLEAARQAQLAKEKAIQDVKDEKIYQKGRIRRKKLYAIEDRKRWKRRKKQDKRDMKQVKKYENVPDTLLVAESLVDVGKFGAKAFCDIMRIVCRIIRHPRDGVHNVKDAVHEPLVAAKEVKESCEGMGLFSTGQRVKHRFLKMKITKDAITKLESYPVTNYMLHMADKSPKHRMKKFKKKRYREPIDFECSLFMASLRKRPCLRVYYMCPWFYPHCVSLLGIWKQFTDILLFILAVGVWSPCILCMELCRAMMCCCLCTG